jgi:hypothetical protein
MSIEKQADYKPSEEEILNAIDAYVAAVANSSNIFKIGRCARDGFRGLQHREMYEDHESITEIFSGSREKAAWLERALTEWALRNQPDRCINEKAGGGGMGEAEDHVVYIVQWKPTRALTRKAIYNFFLRKYGDAPQE